MAKILVLYYSSYGHMELMAEAAAEGARSVAGTTVDIKRVPELVPDDVAKAAHYKLDQAAPVAQINDLADYDGIIFGVPTRFGRMSAQMANFLDQGGGLWFQHKLVGKVGSVMTSTSTQHGGLESTIMSTVVNLLCFGMTVVGLPYTESRQTTIDEISGGSPFGAGTITGGNGARMPSVIELEMAKSQGRHVAETAGKLVRGAA